MLSHHCSHAGGGRQALYHLVGVTCLSPHVFVGKVSSCPTPAALRREVWVHAGT